MHRVNETVLLGSHGRYGRDYLVTVQIVLGNCSNDGHEISSSFSPARTGAQRLDVLR
jgi:hypothetical protein